MVEIHEYSSYDERPSTLHPETRLLRLVMAWQNFGGKSLRIVDHAKCLTETELSRMEECLLRFADSLETEDKTKWPDLHKLAKQIREAINPSYPHERSE